MPRSTPQLITSTPKPLTKSNKNNRNNNQSIKQKGFCSSYSEANILHQQQAHRHINTTTGYRSNLLRLISGSTAIQYVAPRAAAGISNAVVMDESARNNTNFQPNNVSKNFAGGDRRESTSDALEADRLPHFSSEDNKHKEDIDEMGVEKEDSIEHDDKHDDETIDMETINSRPMMFRRRYYAHLRNINADDTAKSVPEITEPTPDKSSDCSEETTPSTSMVDRYAGSVERILQMMNSHNVARSQIPLDSCRLLLGAGDGASGSPGSDSSPDETTTAALARHRPCPYSYYALFFMLAANVFGFALSLSFQVMMMLKLNGDRLLLRAWHVWSDSVVHGRRQQTAGTSGNDGNAMLRYAILLPVFAVGLVAYAIVWLLFYVNRFLLSAVPNRVAQLINFNIQIVY